MHKLYFAQEKKILYTNSSYFQVGEETSVRSILPSKKTSIDVLIFRELTPLVCYKHATELKLYKKDCKIQNNSINEVYSDLRKFKRNILNNNLLDMRSEKFIIVLDNSPFLHDPNTTSSSILVTTTFFVEIDTIKTYYYWTIGRKAYV